MVALAVHPPGEREAALAIGPGRNIGPGVSLRHGRSQIIGIVTTVCQQYMAALYVDGQCFRLCAVRNLFACQAEFDRSAFGIDECVDLAREATAGTSRAAIVSSPFFPVAPCWWTRTLVEPIMTISFS